MGPDFNFCPDCGVSLEATGDAVPGSIRPPPREAADMRLRHLPEALADKLRNVSSAAGERKRVTVMFCDLAGSTAIAENLDPEVFREVLDRYLALTFEEISRFEGLVNQLAGDGLMALFGAPIAHEDEPARAVRAALRIQEALVGLSSTLEDELGFPLEARIGINTGTVVAGTVGNDLKMDYTAIGDTTNLASRLQGLARPGSVLISDATARLVEGRFELNPLSPFRVRGKSQPIVAHEVAGAVDVASPMEIAEARGLTPFVGRSAELDQLESCFERLDRGLFQIVEVVGAAGSGKSRLLHEFRRSIERSDPILYEGRCSALRRNTPYGVWEGMLRGFIGLGSSERSAEIVAKVDELLLAPGFCTEQEAAYLCRFLGVSTEAIAAEPGEITAKKVGSAYQSMLLRAAERGRLVILLEDLQWIDDASRGGLHEVLDSIASMGAMIVVTHRPDYEHEWQVNGAVTQLRLRPLPRDESRTMVRSVAGGELPSALEDRLVERAEGNPFFLEEVVRKLVDEGAIVREERGASVGQAVDGIEIPATVQEVMTARLDHLRPGAKRVAQVASVLGRQFESTTLTALLRGEAVDVPRELGELERAGIVHRKNTGGDEEFRFGESFTQEVAYDSLLLRERRRLHDRVGEALDGGDDHLLSTRNAQVARHFARGNDPERGIQALLAAGEHAEAIPSFGDAVASYREAWDLADAALHAAARPSVELRTWALRSALRLTNAIVLYGAIQSSPDDRAAVRGIELAKELGDTEALARLHASYGMFVMNLGRGRFGEGLDLIREGYVAAKGGGNDRAAVALTRSLAFGLLLDGQFDDAERQIDKAITALDQFGEAEKLSDAYLGVRYFRQRVLQESDRLAEAEAYAHATLELALQADNRTIESAVTSGLASICLAYGRYDEAIHLSTRGLELSSEIGNVGAIRSAAAVRTIARASLGDCASNAADFEAMQHGLLTAGDLALNIDLIISAFVISGEVDRARKLAELATERSGGRLRETRQLLALGEALHAGHDGDPRRAMSCYGEALEIARTIGARSSQARAHAGLAWLATERGEDAVAYENARRTLQIYEELDLDHQARAARSILTTLSGETTLPPAGPEA